MRWFKHLSDGRANPKLLRIQRVLGEAGYARAFKLLEILAQRGGSGPDFRPQLNLNDPAADLQWLAGELGISPREARRTLDTFARVGFIEPDSWKKHIVFMPAMLTIRDEWASRPTKSREQLPSGSGETPPRVESDQRSEVKVKAKPDPDLDLERRAKFAAS